MMFATISSVPSGHVHVQRKPAASAPDNLQLFALSYDATKHSRPRTFAPDIFCYFISAAD
jgi:hypothetical protein